MKAIINLDMDIVFNPERVEYYSVADWASIIIKDLKSYNLPLGEDYQIGVLSFGEEVAFNFSDHYVYIINQYIGMGNFADLWPAIDYIIKVAND